MVNVTCQHKQTQQHSPLNSVYAVSLALNSLTVLIFIL